MKTLASLFLSLVLVAPPANGQTSVSGYVISLETRAPIQGALVMLKDSIGVSIPRYPPVRTDEDGRYEFRRVPRGRYALRASAIFNVEGKRTGYFLAANLVDIGESSEQIDFGFSILALQRQMTHRGTTRMVGKEQARDKLFRSRVVGGRGEQLLSVSWYEAITGQPQKPD